VAALRDTLDPLEERAARLAPPADRRRLVAIAVWLALALGLVVVRFPQSFADANRTARANASLDLVDRAIGGGNSVVPDQGLLLEARARIPPDETFRVALGERQTGWSDLTAPFAETFATFFLLPRRTDPDAEWILCFACERAEFPAADAVWEGEYGLSLLRGEQ